MDFVTFARMALAINIIRIGYGSAQEYEGEPCRLDDNTIGICKNITNCQSIRKGLMTGTFGYNNIVGCSFIGTVQIVCCADERPLLAANRTPLEQNNSLIFGSTSDLMAEKSMSSSSDTKPTHIPGKRAESACELYSRFRIPAALEIHPLGKGLTYGEFPWMAAIGYADLNSDIIFDCTGTLISDCFVLSAAHCARPRRPPQMVRLGIVTLLTNDDDDSDPVDINIKEIIRHPEYKASTRQNDIALFRLAKRVQFTDIVRPACLRTDLSDVKPDIKLIVTGWGSFPTSITDETKTKRPSVLLKSIVTTMPLQMCRTTLLNHNRQVKEASLRNDLSLRQYCAFDPRNYVCPGDSSLLQAFPNTSDIASIVGVLSFGGNCGTPLPMVFTRVASYIKFIEPIVWPNL
ncbi:serine protease persephone-like isoform X2 [Sitodiplosis mosellana]|uniref:serine protease persephone-like isoform X2 n=1 Tax=Sitodiplosis mosellana TaxID=263140 RepID=UPI00244409F2|nr:serine protease persephone-like isoform X2 [Sitodiplosis mosellana]